MDIERLISHPTNTLPPKPDMVQQCPQEPFSPTSSISSGSPTIVSTSTMQNPQNGGPIRNHHHRHHHHHHHHLLNQKLHTLYPSTLPDVQITNGTIPRTASPPHHLPPQDQNHHSPHVHHSTQTPNRRLAHILSEQKRRENINSGFEELKNIVPSCRGCADSKAVILRKAVHYIQNLESEIQKLKHNSISSTPSPLSSTPSPSPIINNKQLPVNGNNLNPNDLSTNGFPGPLPPMRAGVGLNGSAAMFENENQKFDNLYKQQQQQQQQQQLMMSQEYHLNDQWRTPLNNNNNNNNNADQPVAYMPNGNASFDTPQATNNMKHHHHHHPYSDEYRYHQNSINSAAKFHPDNYSSPRVADGERYLKNEEMNWRLAKSNLPLQQQQLFIERRPCCRNPSSSFERILVKQEEMVASSVRI